MMARDASKRLRELVAQGEQLPYDVREAEAGSPLPQYVPLTERFIRDHAQALSALDSFGAACAAIESAELASPYLESFGIGVPGEPRKRGELAGVVFLCRLWAGSTDFSLEDARLAAAIAELEAGGEIAEDEIEVIVPLRGFHMPITQARARHRDIVRADTVDVPAEAKAAEGSGAAGWEPTFLAATRVSESDAGRRPEPRTPARGPSRRSASSSPRFASTRAEASASALTRGPAPASIAGAGSRPAPGSPRPGGYRLVEEELSDLAIFSRTLAYRSTAFGRPAKSEPGLSGALARAISRFEAGLERAVVIDALNDYLLALRFVLEGGGAAQLGLPIRVAALCAEPEQRGETKAVIDRAVGLERELWSGEPAPRRGRPDPGADGRGGRGPDARDLEGCRMRASRQRPAGDGGRDPARRRPRGRRGARRAARRLRGVGVAWTKPHPRTAPRRPARCRSPSSRRRSRTEPRPTTTPPRLARGPRRTPTPSPPEGPGDALDGRPGGVARGRARPRSRNECRCRSPKGESRSSHAPAQEEETVFERQAHAREPEPTTVDEVEPPTPTRRRARRGSSSPRSEPQERADTRRARRLPVSRPETTEWNVRELSYDRRRRAQIRAS